MYLNSLQQEHKALIHDFLKQMNQHTDSFVLKGGTALMECYELDRFSEDIYLDATHEKLNDFIKDFCTKNGYAFRVAKETPTVNRFMIAYSKTSSKPLKVEISYRLKNISPNLYHKVNGIQVYSIDRMAQLKASAYQGRDRIRDLYDICFICDRYFSELSEGTLNQVRDALSYKGFENCDYLIETQQDTLIDGNKLADSFLNTFDRLGLLYTEQEKKDILFNHKSKSDIRY